MPEAYERHLVPVFFRPFAADLAARAAALRPRTILELAAGTGALTSALLAAVPTASVVAPDLNEAMVTADLMAAGLALATTEGVTLESVAESAASIATGFLTGTPVSAAVQAREDAQALRSAVTQKMTGRLGTGPVTAPMTATVYTAHQ
ncbi:class I SAM-dependent methyltransferase [Streptomyces sp. NPDC050508]|uniref:class I SAM-dependent methyltransferase n=1 Tax=Streptomyces sp. NPDC050508 TaxID=3155405 RepID=UPI00343CD353